MVKQTPPWLSTVELAMAGILAPWFIVPSLGFQPWLMVIPLLCWGLRLVFTHQLTTRTPLDVPILGMSVMLGVSMLVTFDPLLSLPKAIGIFYGIIVYFAIVNNMSWNPTKRIVLPSLLLAGFAIAGFSLFGMRWSGAKLPWIGTQLKQLVEHIPRILKDIPRAEKGISTNQLGGTLILFIPMQAAFFIYTLTTWRRKTLDSARCLALGTSLSLSLFVLLLTQSRGAIATALVILSILSVFYLRHHRWIIFTFLILGIVLCSMVIFGVQTNDQLTENDIEELTDSFDLRSRPEIWVRAYRMLQDHPFTGIGFDAFPKVLSARYPTLQMPSERSQVIPHAHNLYLQTALDLGLPGFIAFLALHILVGWMLIRTVRLTHSPLIQATAIGLLLGLTAQLLYGWVDCIALGQKPSIFFWVYLAISTVVYKAGIEDSHAHTVVQIYP